MTLNPNLYTDNSKDSIMAKKKSIPQVAVKVTAYKTFLAIELLATKSISEKLTLSIDNPGCIGQVIHGLKDQLGVSKEALKLLAQIGKSRDSIGDVDCFKSDDGNLNFCWLGGTHKLINVTPGNALGSSTYVAPTEKDVTVIPNEFPAEAKAVVDKNS